MEFYQIRQFLAFARCGNITRAAEETHTSQPALSRALRRLEEELEVPLFTRTKNSIALNDYGLLAAELARKIDESVSAMQTELRARYQKERTVTVESCAPAPLWILEPLVAQTFPKCATTFTLKDPAEIRADLESGAAQVGVLMCADSVGEYFCRKLASERLFFSAPKGHRLAGKKSVSFSDIDGETMLLMRDIGFWRKVHTDFMPKSHFVVQSERRDFLTLVDASSLPSFTSDIVIAREGVPPDRVPIPISDSEAQTDYYAMCKKSEYARLKPLFDAMHRAADGK